MGKNKRFLLTLVQQLQPTDILHCSKHLQNIEIKISCACRVSSRTQSLSAREDGDSHCTPGFSSSRNSCIWCATQVLSAFFNTCQIDWCFSCILHFCSHHQCCIVQSCFIYEVVTSTKLAFLNIQNSKCKYSPMPLEFQFKESPLALGIPVQRTPHCPRNSKKPSIVLYGYFLELHIIFQDFYLYQLRKKYMLLLL